MISNIDINKVVVSNKISFGKKGFKYFIGYKDAKKLDIYAYSFQKWAHIEEILINVNMCLLWQKNVSFLTKNDELLEKYNEIWKKSAIPSKKNLIVILYIMKKIL